MTTDIPDLSIVLVTWNNRSYLEPCLHSLFAGGLRHRFDVVVVDNGSTDGTQALLQERFPHVRLIQNERNVGLSRASNQGIAATRGYNVLLLNDDTLVDGRSLDALVDFMAGHPDAGAVGGKLLNADGTFQAGHGRFSTLWQELLIATRLGPLVQPNYPSYGDAPQPCAVDWLSSACLLLRRAALDVVGLLDEEYFIYGDEADLQYRLKRAGWQVYYLPQVTTIHYGGRSLDRWRRRKMVYRGKMLFYRKNYGSLRAAALRALLGALTLAKLACWGPVWLVPAWRQRAAREVRSNLDVLQICWHLE